MGMIVKEDLTRLLEVLAVGLEEHHSAPLVNDTALRHKA